MFDRTGKDVRHFWRPHQSPLSRYSFPVPRYPIPVLRHLNDLLRGLEPALVLERRDSDDFAAKRARNLLEVDLVAILPHDVHHVDGHHHRKAKFRELRREVQVALDVRAVHDVEYRIRPLFDEKPARDLLLDGVGREGVDAREILYDNLLVPGEYAVLLLDRDARPVADVLLRPSKRIEERGLAAVRVAREGDLDVLRQCSPPHPSQLRR